MRTDVPGLRALLQQKHYNVWARLFINRLSYASLNLSDIDGQDVLLGATWTEDQESPCASGTIQLFRKAGETNLSPLVNNGFNGGTLPRIWPGSGFVLETACVAPGETPGPGDWMSVFEGRIDKVALADDEKSLSLTCRDRGGYFLNEWLWPKPGTADEGLSSLKFGSDAGTRLDVVMQDVIDYMHPTYYSHFYTSNGPFIPIAFGQIPLVVPEVPNFYITTYPQRLGPLLEILQQLALQIGWDCRFRYDSSGQSVITLINVNRSGYVGDYTSIGPDEYLKIKSLDVDDYDLRNWIEVFTSDRQIVVAQDPDSRLQYGMRPMRVVEDVSSHIDTVEEAQAMADAALSDLKDPAATHEIELLYWPIVQLNDIHQYLPNYQYYDTMQTMAVTRFTHTLGINTHRTTIGARGKPMLTRSRWSAGSPRMVHVATSDPVGTAEERAQWLKVASLDFPS